MSATALTIRQALKSSGPASAERQLSIIGSDAGDEQLALVVQDLLPEEIASIVGQGDFTKPSIASSFILPIQFLGALERFGSRWTMGRLRAKEVARPDIYQQVTDFVLSVVLTREEGFERHQLLRALLGHSLGKDVVLMMAMSLDNPMEFLQEDHINAAAAEKGTWQELYSEIDSMDHEVLLELSHEIKLLFSDEVDDEGKTESPVLQFCRRTLNEMMRVAATHVQKESPPKKESELFGDL